MASPKVYIVGAGPYDPELITLKGYRILQKADVILYDRLVNIELLQGLKAKKIFVGKKKKIHYYSQDAINRLLIEYAKQGKVTVRLKGGDPMVFGRGGEEIKALVENGIDFTVIPGLSSCTAVASSIGLPLTHRDIASSFAVITGHTKDGANKARLPKADTLVFLMGLSALADIAGELIRSGHDADAKIAVISKGTHKDERYIIAPLRDIVAAVEASGAASPAVIIFGEVVNWYDDLMASKNSGKSNALPDQFISYCS